MPPLHVTSCSYFYTTQCWPKLPHPELKNWKPFPYKVSKKLKENPPNESETFHQTAWACCSNFSISNPLLNNPPRKGITHYVHTYPCISDLKNEIDQGDAFLNGARCGSHVRAVPSSFSSRVSVSGCFGNGTAYLSCNTSRCHFARNFKNQLNVVQIPPGTYW